MFHGGVTMGTFWVRAEWVDGWVAKIDDGFGYIWYLQGGSIGLVCGMGGCTSFNIYMSHVKFTSQITKKYDGFKIGKLLLELYFFDLFTWEKD